MKIIFFGLGSIGRRHVRVLKRHFNHELFALRSKKVRAEREKGVHELDSWSDIQKVQPDIAFITNPTALHIPTAIRCAEHKMHLFIEKPLSHNLDRVESLAALCKKHKLICYAAYCLRFHPLIQKMKQFLSGKTIYHARIVCSSFLPSWRTGRRSAKSYSSYARLGGGVVFDLSHEFDYIQYLLGDIASIRGMQGRISSVTVDADDYADAFIAFRKKPFIANLHLDFMSLHNERMIKVDFKNGFCIGDIMRNTLIYRFGKKTTRCTYSINFNELLRRQSEFFFRAARKGRCNINDLKESKTLLQKIVAFKSKSWLR